MTAVDLVALKERVLTLELSKGLITPLSIEAQAAQFAMERDASFNPMKSYQELADTLIKPGNGFWAKPRTKPTRVFR